MFDADDLSWVCNVFVEEASRPDAAGLAPNVADRNEHELPNGWHSFRVLGTALRLSGSYELGMQTKTECSTQQLRAPSLTKITVIGGCALRGQIALG